MRTDKKVDLDSHLSKVTPSLHELMRELRRAILESVPDLSEAVKWGNLVYEKNGVVCYLPGSTSAARPIERNLYSERRRTQSWS